MTSYNLPGHRNPPEPPKKDQYIDELGIKTAKSLEKYISEKCEVDIKSYKIARGVAIVYSKNSKLYEEFIKASVIYVIKIEELERVIKNINNTLNNN